MIEEVRQDTERVGLPKKNEQQSSQGKIVTMMDITDISSVFTNGGGLKKMAPKINCFVLTS